ncbi:MAG: hypothetical protein ABSE87_04300 [Terracidiphilus sp.]
MQFLEVWVPYAAFAGASFAILVWLLSIDSGRKDKQLASSEFWSILWPLVWLYYRFVGKHSDQAARRAARSTALMGTSEQRMRFRTIREAKDYLAERISEEAVRDGIPLTDIERKMLYFTETGWTLPDMKQVSADFDRNYDQGEYEKKIGGLADRIQSHLRANNGQGEESWNAAIEKLSHGDHYLLVLVNAANPVGKGVKHNLKVLIVALVLFALIALDHWFRQWMRDH